MWHPHDQHNYVDADDFVLQTKLELLEASDSKRKTTDSRFDYGKEPCNIDNNDVDKICKVLRLNFTSFEDLFQAFVGCNVDISEVLINTVLKRFSNDWFPAFGFFWWAGAQASFKHSPISYDMWGDSIKTFKSIESFGVRKDTIAINALLDTLCKEKRVKHERDAFLELRDGVQPNASSFNILIHGWSKAWKIEEVIRMIEEMREFGYTPCVITFTSLIEGYCLEKNFRMVSAILNEMCGYGCQPNVVTYTIIMHSLAKAKEIQEALLVFEMMKDDGCAPDTSFYNSLIFLMGKSGKLRDAHHIFEQMFKNDILPDVTTFNTLISASCDYSEAENALNLVFSMQEFDCKPDIKTYTPLLKLCCKWKWHNYVDADDFVLQTKLEFLEASDSKRKTTGSRLDYGKEPCHIDDNDVDKICKVLRLNFTSFEDLFQAFVGWKSKQFDVIWSLINEMVCLGGLVSLTTMTKVMRRLAGAGRWGDAIKTFKSIESFGVRKDTIAMNALLDTLCKQKSVKHARDAFLELRDEVQPNASSFNILIHGWSKARKIEEAIRMIEEMREFSYTPCVITFTSLIEGYCLEKNFRMASAILNEMSGHGCQPNVVTYTIIMHSLAKAKEIQEALLVFEMMKDDGCAPDTSFYNSLIFLMGKSGKLRDAHHIFEQMCKNGILPDVTTFNTLISASCDYSEAENALKLVFSMQEFDCKPEIKTYTPLLKLCCKWKWISYDLAFDLGFRCLLVLLNT
ncbi:hypothetical protein ZIOFF_028860 [Zingiber officinale]|uniref:Pentatricopeptide repeat-containing protein n=1 Tax=Zingiber officinale TaxID=94328 RepID=A0A8J5LA54_ZINOF|nr:hypothetical protein ZIOFF_028860 [Zingiber officinale]